MADLQAGQAELAAQQQALATPDRRAAGCRASPEQTWDDQLVQIQKLSVMKEPRLDH